MDNNETKRIIDGLVEGARKEHERKKKLQNVAFEALLNMELDEEESAVMGRIFLRLVDQIKRRDKAE